MDNEWVYLHQDATNTLDYTTITDRLRTVRWSDNSHPTGVVNLRIKGPSFLLPVIAVQSKGQTFKNLFRGVPRVFLMWTPKEGGGLGAALRPPMGPGRSPVGGPGGEGPGS